MVYVEGWEYFHLLGLPVAISAIVIFFTVRRRLRDRRFYRYRQRPRS
jgi:hypothetical protein